MVIGSNVVEALWRKGSQAPHGRFLDSKRDFLWSLAGGITPQQSASIHKIFTRIPQGFHKITAQKTTEITSVLHVKTLEHVCHTGRTHEPPEISC